MPQRHTVRYVIIFVLVISQYALRVSDSTTFPEGLFKIVSQNLVIANKYMYSCCDCALCMHEGV